MSSSKDLFN